jgi:hypothetical protein
MAPAGLAITEPPPIKHIVTLMTLAGMILLAAISSRGVAQNFGRGGFGPSPQAQAAAKAQTESATKPMHGYLNAVGYKLLAERAGRVKAITAKEQAAGLARDAALGRTERIKIIHRGFGHPLPFEPQERTAPSAKPAQ